jgi:uncharacterized protein
LQKCADYNQWVFYPRNICPYCWSTHLEWCSASGNATLKTWSIIHRPGHPDWQGVSPYVLGVVESEEGPTMLTQLLVDSHQELRIGLPCKFPIQSVMMFGYLFSKLTTDNK